MIVSRIPPYPLSVTYDAPGDDAIFLFVLEDVSDVGVIYTEEVTVAAGGTKLTLVLPNEIALYDKTYSLSVYEVTGRNSDNTPIYSVFDALIEDNLTIERPYVNPATLGATASEIAQFAEYEQLARAIIDAHTGGFYFGTSYIETTGNGTDYIPLWQKTYKILKVYENSELVYDSSLETPALGDWNYLITKDRTAITKDPVYSIDSVNRSESAPHRLPIAESDAISLFETDDVGRTFTIQPGVFFGHGKDYIFKVESGYKVVPVDIKDATMLLIEDIKCGKLDYFKRYVVSYNTDQFRLQFDKSMISGTGNLLVDKILEKYQTNIGKPGVL